MAPGIITGPEGVIMGTRKSNDNLFMQLSPASRRKQYPRNDFIGS